MTDKEYAEMINNDNCIEDIMEDPIPDVGEPLKHQCKKALAEFEKIMKDMFKDVIP
jgi:hypothetical protein